MKKALLTAATVVLFLPATGAWAEEKAPQKTERQQVGQTADTKPSFTLDLGRWLTERFRAKDGSSSSTAPAKFPPQIFPLDFPAEDYPVVCPVPLERSHCPIV